MSNESIRLTPRMKEIVDNIERIHDDITIVKDKKGNKQRAYQLSMIVSIFSSDVPLLKQIFPYFNISQIYGMYHLIGFNKQKDWGVLRLPDIE